MNEDEIQGYLCFQPVKQYLSQRLKGDLANPLAEFDEKLLDETSEQYGADGRLTYLANGWFRVTHSILEGEFLKIAADRDQIRVEARFNTVRNVNMVKNVPEGNNGSYAISSGVFAGSGTFLQVQRKPREDPDFLAKDSADCAHFFVCRSSSSGKGKHYLRWRFALREFSNVDATE